MSEKMWRSRKYGKVLFQNIYVSTSSSVLFKKSYVKVKSDENENCIGKL
jgi:hypothetical protein